MNAGLVHRFTGRHSLFWKVVILLLAASVYLISEKASLAQGPLTVTARYLHDLWTTENGLPQNSITALIQTRDGYLWLGTFGGLARFDGIKFTVFNSGNSPGLKGDRIVSLFEDRAGNLWIGTEHNGLTRYAQGKFTAYTTGEGLPDDQVTSVCQDDEGALWIGTERGLVRLKADSFTTYTTRDGLPADSVHSLRAAADGSLWFLSGDKIIRYYKGRFVVYGPADGIPLSSSYKICKGSDGSIWIITANAELIRFRDNAFTTYKLSEDLPGDLAVPICEDRQGNICIPTLKGFARFKDGNVTRFDIKGMPQGVRSIIEDREGNIWIGSDASGLHRLKEAQLISYASEDGLPDESIVPITEDSEGGMWIGSLNSGLFRFHGGAFTRYTSWKALWALCWTRDGSLLLSDFSGVRRLKDGQFSFLYRADGKVCGFGGATVIYQDREGALWFGRNGLLRYKDGNVIQYQVKEGLAHNEVRFITEDMDGALLIGTLGGLSRFKDGKFTNYTTAGGLSNDHVRAVHQTADGTLWIGTYGGGLNRFKDSKLVHITTKDGLFDNVVSRILEDDRGYLWMSCNRGIFRASLKELNDFADGKIASISCASYGVADGMKTSECNGGGQPAGWKARDGKLWFPTIKGVVVVDPNKINSLPPVVAIEKVLINKAEIDLWQKTELAPGQGDLEIHYTGLSFVAPDKVRFKYRLEGYDRDWIDAGTRRAAYYTNLWPGSYTFRVIASNNDRVWNETGAGYEFYLPPRFYQTKTFYALSVIALAMMGVGGYRLRVKHLVRRTQELETKVSERTLELMQQKDRLTQTNSRIEQVNTQLEQANAQLERANDDLLSTFNQLRLGVVLTERDGVVTFLSQTAEDLLEMTQQEALGIPWEQLLPVNEQDRSQLKTILKFPPQRRAKLPLQVRTGSGRRYWMEIEVKDDPRDPERKIFFLYDVSEIYDLRSLLDEKAQFQGLVGQSIQMQVVYKQIQDVARVDTTVLIEGETGTGKELVARAIHYSSLRKNKPFIAVNCAGLTESLLASQLFGHKRGAFTGAVSDHIGMFESAGGGTLFLDEIGDIPMSVQTSLLRVLQEREITRLGESKPRKIDVRIIAATHRDLNQAVAQGTFRQDLLYRIRVAKIQLPALRNRREDIPLLVAWFLGQARTATGKVVHDVSNEVMEILMEHTWPGNVRELKSAIESAVIRCKGSIVQRSDLSLEASTRSYRQSFTDDVQEARQRVLDALARANGNRAAAARMLGVSRTTLYRRLKALGLDDE